MDVKPRVPLLPKAAATPVGIVIGDLGPSVSGRHTASGGYTYHRSRPPPKAGGGYGRHALRRRAEGTTAASNEEPKGAAAAQGGGDTLRYCDW